MPKDVKDERGSLFTSTMIAKGTTVLQTTNIFIDRINRSIREFDDLADNLLAKHKKKFASRCDAEQDLLDFLDASRYIQCCILGRMAPPKH